ncbi:MAG: hypothetical protein AB2541_18605 [Candidatus Thiodiazotropha sp.]
MEYPFHKSTVQRNDSLIDLERHSEEANNSVTKSPVGPATMSNIIHHPGFYKPV